MWRRQPKVLLLVCDIQRDREYQSAPMPMFRDGTSRCPGTHPESRQSQISVRSAAARCAQTGCPPRSELWQSTSQPERSGWSRIPRRKHLQRRCARSHIRCIEPIREQHCRESDQRPFIRGKCIQPAYPSSSNVEAQQREWQQATRRTHSDGGQNPSGSRPFHNAVGAHHSRSTTTLPLCVYAPWVAHLKPRYLQLQPPPGSNSASRTDRVPSGPVIRNHSGPDAASSVSSKVRNGQHLRSFATKRATASKSSGRKRTA